MTGGIHKWFDLHDEATTLETLASMVASYGRESDISQYWLNLHDPDTGEFRRRLETSPAELASIRDGTRTAAGTPAPWALEDIPDDALIRELARRLRER